MTNAQAINKVIRDEAHAATPSQRATAIMLCRRTVRRWRNQPNPPREVGYVASLHMLAIYRAVARRAGDPA